jgi:hypothetical protein
MTTYQRIHRSCAVILLLAGLWSGATAGTRYEAMVVGRDTLTKIQSQLGRYVKIYASGDRLALPDFENFRIIIYQKGASLSESTPVKTLGTFGISVNDVSYAANGQERLNAEFSVSFWNDTLYVANYNFGEILRFTRDGNYIDSKPGRYRVLATDASHLYAMVSDSIFLRNAATGSFEFKAKIPGAVTTSADWNYTNVKIGPNRLSVRKDTTVSVYDLSQVLSGSGPAPLFTVHAHNLYESGFTNSQFVWAIGYPGTYGASDLNGGTTTSGDFALYGGNYNFAGGTMYLFGPSTLGVFDSTLQKITTSNRLTQYLQLNLLGADGTNLFFYDGAVGGLQIAPLDDAHGQFVVNRTNKIYYSANTRMFRNGAHYKYTLDSFPADTAAIRVFSVDSMLTRRFASKAAVAIGTVGDTVFALSGNRVYPHLPDGTALPMITLATADTTGNLGFTCSSNRFFLGSNNSIKAFNRSGGLVTSYPFTMYNAVGLWMAGSSVFCNSPVAFLYLPAGTTAPLPGLDWSYIFNAGKYWYRFAPNVYQYTDVGTTGVRDQQADAPNTFALAQNYPNPFNPATRISFQTGSTTRVRLAVYDVLGREVRVLVDAVQDAGVHEVQFDANGLASGVYIARLSAGTENLTRQMLLIR